jgi:hypothetical protein
MPTKLVDFADQEQQLYQKSSVQARKDLTTAQQTVRDSQAHLTKVTGQLAALEREGNTIRQELELIPTPADAEPLLAKLEENIIATRAKRSQLLDADDQLELARQGAGRLQAELRRATAALQAASSRHDAEKRQAEIREGWKERLGEPPLKTLQQDATATLQGTPWNTARGNLRKALSDPLFNRAMQRGQEVTSRIGGVQTTVTQAEDTVAETRKATHGTAGAAALSGAVFRRAEAALGDYVANAKGRFDRAVALFTPIVPPEATKLTPEEQEKVNDAKLTESRTKAIEKELAVSEARAAHDTALAAVGDAEMAALAKDPDADLGSDPAVKEARDKLKAAEDKLQAARDAYTADMRKLLDQWEAAVPDRVWRLAADFHQARVIFGRLRDLDPKTLAGPMDAAEGAYGDDLVAEAKATRALAVLEDRTGRRADQLAAVTRTEPARTGGAVRGDE